MEKTNKIFQNSNSKQQTLLSSRDGRREIFQVLDLREVTQVVLDGGREIVKAIPGSENIGSIMMLIEPRCIEAHTWLGALGTFNESDGCSCQTEYCLCEPIDKLSGHRIWELHGLSLRDCRAEIMMRFAYVEYLSKMQVWKGKKESQDELNIRSARCLPKNGYSTRRGVINLRIYYRGCNMIHFDIGFAGVLDERGNWRDDCEYECICKIARNLWKYLEQTIKQRCAPECFSHMDLLICTADGLTKNMEDL